MNYSFTFKIVKYYDSAFKFLLSRRAFESQKQAKHNSHQAKILKNTRFPKVYLIQMAI